MPRNYKIEEIDAATFNWIHEDGTTSKDFETYGECKEDAQKDAAKR